MRGYGCEMVCVSHVCFLCACVCLCMCVCYCATLSLSSIERSRLNLACHSDRFPLMSETISGRGCDPSSILDPLCRRDSMKPSIAVYSRFTLQPPPPVASTTATATTTEHSATDMGTCTTRRDGSCLSATLPLGTLGLTAAVCVCVCIVVLLWCWW